MSNHTTLTRRISAVLKQPMLGFEYATWLVKHAFSTNGPTKVIGRDVIVGSFANFSEYHSVKNFVSPAELKFWHQFSFADGTFIDVGANLGVVSLLIARRFPHRTIHACEPNPSTFDALLANVKRNSAENIVSHQIAVGEQDGSALFDANPRSRGTAALLKGQSPHAKSVAVQRLDTFCSKWAIDVVSVLKVDVEGFEMAVFRGAEGLLRTKRIRLIHFEIVPELAQQRGFEPTGPAKLLLDAGYSLYRFDGRGDLCDAELTDVSRVISENWIAIAK